MIYECLHRDCVSCSPYGICTCREKETLECGEYRQREEEKQMAADLWAYNPDICDGDFCPMNCDICGKADREEEDEDECP